MSPLIAACMCAHMNLEVNCGRSIVENWRNKTQQGGFDQRTSLCI